MSFRCNFDFWILSSKFAQIFWKSSTLYSTVSRLWTFLQIKILRYSNFTTPCLTMLLVQIWCLYLVHRPLYLLFYLKQLFLTKTAEHDFEFDLYNYKWPMGDLGHNSFRGCVELMLGELLKFSTPLFPDSNLSYWRKSNRGTLWAPPPSGRGLIPCRCKFVYFWGCNGAPIIPIFNIRPKALHGNDGARNNTFSARATPIIYRKRRRWFMLFICCM